MARTSATGRDSQRSSEPTPSRSVAAHTRRGHPLYGSTSAIRPIPSSGTSFCPLLRRASDRALRVGGVICSRSRFRTSERSSLAPGYGDLLSRWPWTATAPSQGQIDALPRRRRRRLVPPSIAHEEFTLRTNILLRRRGSVLIDWAEAAVEHPFCGLVNTPRGFWVDRWGLEPGALSSFGSGTLTFRALDVLRCRCLELGSPS